MARRVAIFTSTRADYGLLYWLMKDIQGDDQLEMKLLVTGAHLSPEFGSTYRAIEQDGFDIDEKVEILMSSDSAQGVAKSLGLGVVGFADALARMAPDLLVVLGDRFEALAVAQTAMIMRIPIMHLHGGEITEGAYDDNIRHAITKLSYVHCTSTEEHRNRVIQLGEAPERVVNVGALGLDHLFRTPLLSVEELAESLGFALRTPYFLVTYHPVTLGDESPKRSFEEICKALDEFPCYQVILTYPNADDGGRQIIPLIESYAAERPERVLAVESLGQKRYLSAMKHAAAVIGNSSSGIIEAPSFAVPTVNIGVRQQGRTAANTVIHCKGCFESIKGAIESATNTALDGSTVDNPYRKDDASRRILSLIESLDLSGSPMKKFFDLRCSHDHSNHC